MAVLTDTVEYFTDLLSCLLANLNLVYWTLGKAVRARSVLFLLLSNFFKEE